ncbi:MAG: GntR family transcriptional regulator [Eubacteriales bacterium]
MSENDKPIFRQIIEHINAGIDSGTYSRGQAIPSEPELSKQFHTTRMTVRRAIDALESQGILYRVQGKGTFVSQFELNRTTQKQGFTNQMLALGLQPSSKVLFMGEGFAAREIREHLEIEPDEPVFLLKRVRLADHDPIAIETVWLSLHRFPRVPEFDFEKESLYEVLHREFSLNLINGYSKRRINAVTVTGDDAIALFGKKKGVALRIRSIDYDRAHRPFAALETIYHSEKYTVDFLV